MPTSSEFLRSREDKENAEALATNKPQRRDTTHKGNTTNAPSARWSFSFSDRFSSSARLNSSRADEKSPSRAHEVKEGHTKVINAAGSSSSALASATGVPAALPIPAASRAYLQASHPTDSARYGRTRTASSMMSGSSIFSPSRQSSIPSTSAARAAANASSDGGPRRISLPCARLPRFALMTASRRAYMGGPSAIPINADATQQTSLQDKGSAAATENNCSAPSEPRSLRRQPSGVAWVRKSSAAPQTSNSNIRCSSALRCESRLAPSPEFWEAESENKGRLTLEEESEQPRLSKHLHHTPLGPFPLPHAGAAVQLDGSGQLRNLQRESSPTGTFEVRTEGAGRGASINAPDGELREDFITLVPESTTTSVGSTEMRSERSPLQAHVSQRSRSRSPTPVVASSGLMTPSPMVYTGVPKGDLADATTASLSLSSPPLECGGGVSVSPPSTKDFPTSSAPPNQVMMPSTVPSTRLACATKATLGLSPQTRSGKAVAEIAPSKGGKASTQEVFVTPSHVSPMLDEPQDAQATSREGVPAESEALPVREASSEKRAPSTASTTDGTTAPAICLGDDHRESTVSHLPIGRPPLPELSRAVAAVNSAERGITDATVTCASSPNHVHPTANGQSPSLVSTLVPTCDVVGSKLSLPGSLEAVPRPLQRSPRTPPPDNLVALLEDIQVLRNLEEKKGLLRREVPKDMYNTSDPNSLLKTDSATPRLAAQEMLAPPQDNSALSYVIESDPGVVNDDDERESALDGSSSGTSRATDTTGHAPITPRLRKRIEEEQQRELALLRTITKKRHPENEELLDSPETLIRELERLDADMNRPDGDTEDDSQIRLCETPTADTAPVAEPELHNAESALRQVATGSACTKERKISSLSASGVRDPSKSNGVVHKPINVDGGQPGVGVPPGSAGRVTCTPLKRAMMDGSVPKCGRKLINTSVRRATTQRLDGVRMVQDSSGSSNHSKVATSVPEDLLPALISPQEAANTITVVFDLDETLCNNRCLSGPIMRPGAELLLRTLRGLCPSPQYKLLETHQRSQRASNRLYDEAMHRMGMTPQYQQRVALRQSADGYCCKQPTGTPPNPSVDVEASTAPATVGQGSTGEARPATARDLNPLRLELVLWTASEEGLTRRVMRVLDPQSKIFDEAIYRDGRWYRDSNYTKELCRLGRSMNRVVIIENSIESVIRNRQNAILVSSFVNSRLDRQLFLVREVLRDWVRGMKAKLREQQLLSRSASAVRESLEVPGSDIDSHHSLLAQTVRTSTGTLREQASKNVGPTRFALSSEYLSRSESTTGSSRVSVTPSPEETSQHTEGRRSDTAQRALLVRTAASARSSREAITAFQRNASSPTSATLPHPAPLPLSAMARRAPNIVEFLHHHPLILPDSNFLCFQLTGEVMERLQNKEPTVIAAALLPFSPPAADGQSDSRVSRSTRCGPAPRTQRQVREPPAVPSTPTLPPAPAAGMSAFAGRLSRPSGTFNGGSASQGSANTNAASQQCASPSSEGSEALRRSTQPTDASRLCKSVPRVRRDSIPCSSVSNNVASSPSVAVLSAPQARRTSLVSSKASVACSQ